MSSVRSKRPFLKRLLRHPMNLVGLMMMLGVVAAVVVGPLVIPHSPTRIDAKHVFLAPSKQHWFGTDDAGRDVLARVLYGGRLSLVAGLIVVVVSPLIGIPIGVAAAMRGGMLDELLMRSADMVLSFPQIILALIIVSVLGPGITNAMIAVCVLWWPGYARLARAAVLVEKENTYVEAARSVGASSSRILLRHIAPNIVSPFIVKMTFDYGMSILTMASLGFLGLGAQPPTPEWGSMIALARPFMRVGWWMPTFPGLAMFLTVLGFSLLGDGLRDTLDPRVS